jgi:hypothetical protein
MIYLLVYIHQKKKIALEIAAKIANVNVPLGQKKICGFPVSRPYLAFGRRNPDPKLFYWIMLVSVST